MAACSSSPPPTPTPAPTPATPQDRVDQYDKYLRWHLSLLLRDVQRTAQHHDSKPEAFTSAVGVVISLSGIERLELPDKSDFAAIGEDFDPKPFHGYLLQALMSCRQLGEIAMYAEGETLDSLLSANAACENELQQLKNLYPRLFECPAELGLCP